MINQWDGVKNITCSATAIQCLQTGDQVLTVFGLDKVIILKFLISNF